MGWLCWTFASLFKWEAVTAIATILGVLAVFFQLKGLRQQIKLQNYADYTKRYAEIVLHFPEDVNSQDFKLDKRHKDYSQIMRYMRAYFDLCFEEWDLNRRKLIDLNAWKVWEGGMKTAFRKSAFQQAWKIIRDSDTEYGSEFEKFVANCFVPR